MEKKTIQENIDYLKNSAVYAMSLGSKELFHSNFWVWLMKQDRNVINVFFVLMKFYLTKLKKY